jgi:putative PIN family toxin of toxin-antitoxin system
LISIFTNRPDRPIFQLWAYAIQRRYTLLLSPEVIREVARTLRPTFAWEEPEIIKLAKTLTHVGDLITPEITLDVITTDPDDNRILECGVAGHAHLIVSGDRDLRNLETYEGISIVVPRDFMRMLGIPDNP